MLAAAAVLAAAPAIGENTTPSGAPSAWPRPVMDQHTFGGLFLDRLEYGGGGDGDNLLWDAQGWVGGDLRKLWVKTEGDGPAGESPEASELQLLYDRTITRYWDLQTGVRYDVRYHGRDTGYAVLGVQGLAPQWLQTDAAAFLSEDGDLSFRTEVEYDLLVTQWQKRQRLVLQPRLEVNVSASDNSDLGVGRGLGSTEVGLRLRYEITRELAPYVGVRWERLYGNTGNLARSAGTPVSRSWVVVGIRAWF